MIATIRSALSSFYFAAAIFLSCTTGISLAKCGDFSVDICDEKGNFVRQESDSASAPAEMKQKLQQSTTVSGPLASSELYSAISQNNADLVRRLLSQKQDANAMFTEEKFTALTAAAGYGELVIVKLLLDHGADIERKSAHGTTALMNASAFGHLDVVQELLKRGAQINASDYEGSTALMDAVSKEQFSVVKFLISNGADPLLRSNHGTATDIAQAGKNTEILKIVNDYYIDRLPTTTVSGQVFAFDTAKTEIDTNTGHSSSGTRSKIPFLIIRCMDANDYVLRFDTAPRGLLNKLMNNLTQTYTLKGKVENIPPDAQLAEPFVIFLNFARADCRQCNQHPDVARNVSHYLYLQGIVSN